MTKETNEVSEVSELTPCPFCGGTDLETSNAQYGFWAVHCTNCLAFGPVLDDKNCAENAERAWNNRANERRNQ